MKQENQSLDLGKVQETAKKEKLDKRVVKTRAAIHDAFRSLIREGNTGRITVSALAREARIDRKTFYLHYESVEALIDEEVEGVVGKILSVVDIGEFEKDPLSQVRVALAEVDSIITSDIDFYVYLSHSLSIEFTLDHISRALKRFMLKRDEAVPAMSDARSLIAARFYLAGAVAVYEEWLRGDRSKPISEVSDAILAVLNAASHK